MFSYEVLLSHLKKLAKNNYWQTIYASNKEVPSLHLFRNAVDFTSIQIQFLSELSFYFSLYMDIALNEVSEHVLDNEIFEDSYYYYKAKQRKEASKNKKPTQTNYPVNHQPKGQEKITNNSEWVFTKVKG